MQGLRRQATALCVEADLQVLEGEQTAVGADPASPPARVSTTVTGVVTCSAIFSLLEAGGQLHWEAAASASTVSVWVQSRVKRLRRGAEGCRTQDRKVGEEEVEMFLRKGWLPGTQALPHPHSLRR